MLGDYFIDQALIAGCSIDCHKNKEFKEIFKNVLDITQLICAVPICLSIAQTEPVL